MSDLQQDLHERWLPNAEQMKMADALLLAGYTAARPPEFRERGVYTGHLLINKEYGFWTTDVQLVFLDGVFLTREAVLDFVHLAAEKHYTQHGEPLTGGWAWHFKVGEAAVWEDIMSRYPEP